MSIHFRTANEVRKNVNKFYIDVDFNYILSIVISFELLCRSKQIYKTQGTFTTKSIDPIGSPDWDSTSWDWHQYGWYNTCLVTDAKRHFVLSILLCFGRLTPSTTRIAEFGIKECRWNHFHRGSWTETGGHAAQTNVMCPEKK